MRTVIEDMLIYFNQVFLIYMVVLFIVELLEFEFIYLCVSPFNFIYIWYETKIPTMIVRCGVFII